MPGSFQLVCVLTLSLGLWPGPAQAMEAPSGVVAILSGDDDNPGGSAVLIDRDGLAITLAEALPDGGGTVTVALAGGLRRTATVVRRDARSSATLLRIQRLPAGVDPVPMADSRRLLLLDPVWTAGNATDAILLDGVPTLSRGVVSGLYALIDGAPMARGRAGRPLAPWQGPAIETDAAINDGSQGGALLDTAGQLVGLTSLTQARERRLPLSVPLARILDGLDLPPATTTPAGGGEAWRRAAAAVAPSVGLVYLQRARGPGNPSGVPRPPRALEAAAAGERERLRTWWERHWHQQQVFYTDQPVPALSLGEDLLLTSASNLHGGATYGRLLVADGPIACEVLGRDLPLDLALLRTERPHGLPAAPLAERAPALGQSVALLGRHRVEAGWTATIGIISATERRRTQSRMAYLQIDARANYGSLGAPLVDADGRVAGLCVLLGPHDERPWLINSGVALAVDVGRMREALPAMLEGRTVERPRILGLGVVLRPRGNGLVIESVHPGTGAAAAGLLGGDELLSVDGVRTRSPDAIARALIRRLPGDRIPVELRRDGAELTVAVELTEFTP